MRTGSKTPETVTLSRLVIWLLRASLALPIIFATGCLMSEGSGGFAPITLLDQGGSRVTVYPTTMDAGPNGTVHYRGSALAELPGDPQAGRLASTVSGMADAYLTEGSDQRDFTFVSNSSTDLGWSGLDSGENQLTINGSGPTSGGVATLSAGSTLDSSRSGSWGFSTSSVNVNANLALSAPIFTVSAEGYSVGNPAALVQAPNPGGVSLDASGLGLIFAPVGGDSSLGTVPQGTWVKFVLPGSVPLANGPLFTWNTQAGTLRGNGAIGNLTVQGAAVDATVELTASASSSSLTFSGPMSPAQLGILQQASGKLWTDATCTDCADIAETGNGLNISTLSIPSLSAAIQVRNGATISQVISAQHVTGSLGPVTIADATLSVDATDFSNLVADLSLQGSVLGMPVTTTFHGPFFFDLNQGAIDLNGALYLNLGNKVVLNGNLHTVANFQNVSVSYTGPVQLPSLGGNFNTSANVNYDLVQKSLNLGIQASGNLGPITANNVAIQLGLTQSATSGIDVSGTIGIGSVTAGQASLSNLQVGLSGNTSTALNASINSSTNRVTLAVGTLASINAYGSATYDIANNKFNFALNYAGRVGSWQISNGTVSVVWPGSGSVTGSITAGQISNGQATISNAVVDFTASTSAVTATLKPTTLTAGSMVSATVSGNVTYTLSTNTMNLSLSASGRVGSWNVSGITATATWPGTGNITGTLTVGNVSNGQVTISNAIIDFTASTSSVTANLRPTTITAGTLVSATVSGSATYNISTNKLTLTLTASGRAGPVNVTNVAANVTWPLSGNITGSVTIGTVTYGPASLTGTSISFTASTTSVTASIASTLNVGDPFRLTVGLSGSATYNISNNTLNVVITTGSGSMWGKPITGSVTFNVNVTGSTISGSVSTSSLKFNYDKFGITLSNTSLNFAQSGSTVTVNGSGNVAVTGPLGNGWLSGNGSFTIAGNVLKSTSYHITLNNVNKTITWVDLTPNGSNPLSVDIIAGSLSYDAVGLMEARVNTGFPLYCQDLQFNVHAWGDQNVLHVDFSGSFVLGLFGASGHMDIYDFLTNSNPPMYGYVDARITFFWFRYQTWNGQSFDSGGC